MTREQINTFFVSRGWKKKSRDLIRGMPPYLVELSFSISIYSDSEQRILFNCSYSLESYSKKISFVDGRKRDVAVKFKQENIQPSNRLVVESDLQHFMDQLQHWVGSEDWEKKSARCRSNRDINRYGAGIIPHLTQLAIDGNEEQILRYLHEYKTLSEHGFLGYITEQHFERALVLAAKLRVGDSI